MHIKNRASDVVKTRNPSFWRQLTGFALWRCEFFLSAAKVCEKNCLKKFLRCICGALWCMSCVCWIFMVHSAVFARKLAVYLAFYGAWHGACSITAVIGY